MKPFAWTTPLVAGLLLATTTFAQERPARQGPSFERLDRNGDSKIVKEELPKQAARFFDRIDADSDGSVSKKEFDTFEKVRANMQRQRGNRPVGERPTVNSVRGVEITRDIPYLDTGKPRHKLDIALPEKPATDKPLPVIVLIHGGGWMGGTHGPYLTKALPLVREGKFAAVSLGYRLSREAQWPLQIHDCQAGLRWVKANAEKYNWDPDRIVLWGSSAGGHLVSMLGVSADDEKIDGKLGPHADIDLKVAGVVDFFGPANMLTMGTPEGFARHNKPDSPEAMLLGGAIKEVPEIAKSASPQEYVSAGDAPFLILHGTKDGTVPYQQSVDFHAALRKAGVDSTFVTVEGAGHGFGGNAVNERVRAFLGKIALGEEGEVSSEPIEGAERPQRRNRQPNRDAAN